MKKCKKWFHTSIAFLLALVFLLFPACKTKDKGDDGQGLTPGDTVDVDGKHDISVEETGKRIVEKGETQYRIVVAADAGKNTLFAADELQYFLRLASDVRVPIVRDTEVGYTDDVCLLSVGQNSVASAAGVTYDRSALDISGVRIVTRGNSVFMGGATEYGTMNSVYSFLEETIGLVTYTDEVYEYRTGDTIELYDFDVTDLPDFQWRPTGYGYAYGSLMRRMRYNSIGDMWMGPGSYWHDSFRFLPPSEYLDDYSDWYADDRKQLCYTAHGNSEQLERMYREMFEKVKRVVIENPDAMDISITQEDANEWCTCATCTAEKNKYGTNAAVVIKFCNEIARRLEEWIADNTDGVDKDRKVNVLFFAYRPTEKAPAAKDESGNYVPIDTDVVCRDNVLVLYAPIYVEYTKSFTEGDNLQYAENMKAWQAVSRRQYYWLYSTNFNNYFYPYNNFDVLQENYRYLKSLNAYYIFDQGQFDAGKTTAFHDLKAFLISKLLWDVNADVEKLTGDYFRAVYGEAASTMKTLYTEIRTWMHYLEDKFNITGNIYYPISNDQFFPFMTLSHWQDLIDRAYDDIAGLQKTDLKKYDLYRNNICLESIFVRYALIEHYSGNFSEQTLRQMKLSFIDDVSQLNVKRYKEGQPVEAITSKWGV